MLFGAYLLQRSLLYFPDRKIPNRADYGLVDMDELHLDTADGLKLLTWYKPAAPGKPTILYYHGNAGNIGSRSLMVRPYLAQGYGVLLPEYRGYGGNRGKPSELNFYRDAALAMKYLQQQGIKSNCLVLYGESLGSGVVVEIAKRYPVAAVILQTPFNRLTDVAFHHYPYLPTGLLLKDRYNNQAKIADINAPLLIMHGNNDRVIPIKYAEKLFAAAMEPKQFFTMPDFGHNDINPQMMANQVKEFLQEHHVCGVKEDTTLLP